MKNKMISIVVVFAGLYVAIGMVLQSIAFGPIQVRVADALYPLIAVFGIPCLLGTFLGHLIFNAYGFGVGIALGPLDMLSPFIFLVPKYAIYKTGLKPRPEAKHSVHWQIPNWRLLPVETGCSWQPSYPGYFPSKPV